MHYTPIVWNLILHFYYVQIYTKTSLDHLHSKVHLIHTDIKPENILLVANNADEGDVRIKIIDMGSAVFGCERCDCTHDNAVMATAMVYEHQLSIPGNIGHQRSC